MKHISLTLLLLCTQLLAVAQSYYGYCPMQVEPTDVTAIGTGKNNFMEAAICLDTEVDPLVMKLHEAGAQIAGVRFYVTHDYKQRSQQRSLIQVRQGEATNEPVAKQVDNFVLGWNEIRFAQPVAIAEGKNYVGYQVYETIGAPYPVASYAHANIPTACCITPAREGYQNYLNRGTLLVQAIIEGAEAINNLQNSALVAFSGVKTKMVQPSKPFSCNLYVRNLSSHPITSVEFEGRDAYGVVTPYSVTLSEELAPYDGVAIPYQLVAPSHEGMSESLTLSVTKVNSQTASPTMPTQGVLYVALDAYERVPVVEEFTSQACVNCPFMAYYLDRAMEEYREQGHPCLYVAHHAGFVNDRFTKSPDLELLYLFEGDSYNPAVMYDRRMLSGSQSVLQSAKLAETDPYSEAIIEAASFPALAEVTVIPTLQDGSMSVQVSGSINRYLLQETKDIYLSCYLIENDIKPTGSSGKDGNNYQMGLDDPSAPADLKDKYRHNGVIRNYFNINPAGDKLDIVEGDSYSYNVSYEPQSINKEVVLANCDVVAIVHLIDKKVMQNNFVLNAGSARMQGYFTEGIGAVTTATAQPDHVAYDLQGRQLSRSASAKGLVIRNHRITLCR